MTLKWVYAAMVIAAALVLGFALQDGRPAHEAAGSQRAPEPRVVGGGRTDLALPRPGGMPRRDAIPEAEPAAEGDLSTRLPEAEAPEGTPPAARSRQIAAQTPVERNELEASGGVGRRRAMP